MTIKNRNRINFVFSIITLSMFILSLIFIGFQLFTNTLKFPEVYFSKPQSSSIFLRYSPVFTTAGIIFLLLYITVSSFVIQRTFSKTQSSEIVFFMLFLLACLADTFRLAIPLFHMSGTYSKILLLVGNITLFARFLAPLSLLGIAILSDTDQRKDLEQNVIIIMVAALFFAVFVPINTTKIMPNFCEDYGHKLIIYNISAIITIINVITLFLKVQREQMEQSITIGFFLLNIGYQIVFTCHSLHALLFAILFLISGTILFLFSLHKQFLWNN